MTTAAQEPFSTTVRREGEVAVFELQGDLDATTAWRLDRYVDAALAAGDRRVVVDLEHIAFIDSAGIGAVIEAYTRVRDLGGHLAVRSPSRFTEEALELSGITRLVEIVSDTSFHSRTYADGRLYED